MSEEIIQAKITKGPLSFNMSPIYIEVNGKLVGRCTSTSYSHETGTPVVSLDEFKKYEESLNENQLIVLEWLKETYEARKVNYWFVFDVIKSLSYEFNNLTLDKVNNIEIPHLKAYGEFSNADQFRVLAAFAEWGKQHEPI